MPHLQLCRRRFDAAGTSSAQFGLPSLSAPPRFASERDFNGDGRPYPVAHSTTGENVIWLINGARDSSQRYIRHGSGIRTGASQGVGDFNGNGKSRYPLAQPRAGENVTGS